MSATEPAPVFSIVIPAYNRSAEIGDTLASVGGQTFTQFECIVVDDGSSDGDALQAVVAGLNDSRFRYVRRENGGGGAARNTGIENARGQYIAFLDSDDIYLPHKLETCLARLDADNPKRVVYSAMFVDRGVERRWVRPSRGIGQGEDVAEYLFCANQFIQTSTIVLDRGFALETMFDPMLRKGQDLDFCVRLAENGGTFEMVDEPLVVWRDITEAGRTSRTSGYEAPMQWLRKFDRRMSKRAVRGYRATVLAYYMGSERPLLAGYYLLDGLARARVPLPIVLRNAARTFIPRDTYRKIVNRFVAARGKA